MDGEPTLAALQAREVADVVHRRLRTVLSTGREGDLELARQGEVERMEQEVLVRGHDVRPDVEGLAPPDAGMDTACDIAHTVGAGAAGGDAYGVQPLVDLDHSGEIDPVHLHVL